MKKIQFMFFILILSQAIFAKDEVKNYNCKFTIGMGYKKVDVTFDKDFGNKFTSTINIINADGKEIVEKFRNQLKISKDGGIVYLENKKNSHINPFADESYLRFDDIKQVFGFDKLTNNITLSLYSLSGPVGNRQSDTTHLTCTINSPIAPADINDTKIDNGSRNIIKKPDSDSSFSSSAQPNSAIGK